jgi:hypothetical protein
MIGLQYSNLGASFLSLEALGVNRTIEMDRGGDQFIETEVAVHDLHKHSIPEK